MKRDSITVFEYKKLTKKKSKYRNKRTYINGMWFDSIKEANRYLSLVDMQNRFLISDLKRQVTFPLNINGHHICKYVADFTYTENGERIVEDVKSPMTRKLPVYVLKKALMKAILNIEIREI